MAKNNAILTNAEEGKTVVLHAVDGGVFVEVFEGSLEEADLRYFQAGAKLERQIEAHLNLGYTLES